MEGREGEGRGEEGRRAWEGGSKEREDGRGGRCDEIVQEGRERDYE